MSWSEWVVAWSAEYPGSDDEDARLAPYRGLDRLTRTQVEELIDWKFQGDSLRRSTTRTWLDAEDGKRIKLLTRQAFACTHPLLALLACQVLKGVGPAMASVLLMAQDPERYTVIDSRALASLRCLGRFPPGPKFATSEDWEPYLTTCRKIADKLSCSLRQVDRALYTANGRAGLPGAE